MQGLLLSEQTIKFCHSIRFRSLRPSRIKIERDSRADVAHDGGHADDIHVIRYGLRRESMPEIVEHGCHPLHANDARHANKVAPSVR